MRAFPSSARCRGRAFTLIEMLIVLGIIGVLAAILISQISTQSLAAVQTAYNNATTAKAKVTLVSEYLDSDTYDHFDDNTSDTAKVQSDAMKRIGKWVELPTWAAGSYPRVNLLPVD
jgi:prepilin-type N-terminal cleavage/methylation domain-containing protein